MARFLIKVYIKPLFSRVVKVLKKTKKKKKECPVWGKCYLHVTPFCWTDLPLDNPWYKCTWNDLYFILFKCIEEKKTNSLCDPRSRRCFLWIESWFHHKSNSLIRLVFLKRRLKIGLLEHRQKPIIVLLLLEYTCFFFFFVCCFVFSFWFFFSFHF